MNSRVSTWLSRDPDPKTRQELQGLVDAGNEEEIDRRFRARLAFGTAGLRGVLGAGPNRMNRLVVRETSAGLASHLLATVSDAAERGVVVGYDGRHLSLEFAQDTACVLAARGIRVHLFDHDVPTPVCAFAVRHLRAAAGVVVTASHNPPAYNGYKVYWENGAQIIPPHDKGIAAAIDVAAEADIPWLELDAARGNGRVTTLDDAMVETYLAAIAELSVYDGRAGRDELVLAYTPLHGVGARIAEPALQRAGFTALHTVASQREPDPDFSTVSFPNPEEPGAMDAVLALAREKGAALACANDPDADRLAVAVLRADGDYQMLTGDQIGALLGADRVAHAGDGGCVGTTIVSSRLLGVVAKSRGIGFYETLTGFKWIANVGLDREAKGERFLFGYEEALGYTIGGVVRDKDGISALLCFVEMAAALAADGKTVLDALEAIYREHGLYLTRQKSIALDPDRKGPGVGEMLRQSLPTHIAGRSVDRVTDIASGVRRHADLREEKVDLPASDVLVFLLDDGARVIVRPSGTEPKLKCYYEVCDDVGASESLADAEARLGARLDELVLAHQKEIAALSS